MCTLRGMGERGLSPLAYRPLGPRSTSVCWAAPPCPSAASRPPRFSSCVFCQARDLCLFWTFLRCPQSPQAFSHHSVCASPSPGSIFPLVALSEPDFKTDSKGHLASAQSLPCPSLGHHRAFCSSSLTTSVHLLCPLPFNLVPLTPERRPWRTFAEHGVLCRKAEGPILPVLQSGKQGRLLCMHTTALHREEVELASRRHCPLLLCHLKQAT